MRMLQDLEKFKDETRRLSKVVTGNEVWFYWKQII